MRACAAASLTFVLALAGCGNDEAASTRDRAQTGTGSLTNGAARPPAAPTATATTPAPGTPTQPPAPTNPEAVPGGAGDEEAVRVPARFVIDGERVTPATVKLPAFLGIELTLEATDGREHVVELLLDRAYKIRVGAGQVVSQTLPGQREGNFPLTVDGRMRATLSIGGDAGP